MKTPTVSFNSKLLLSSIGIVYLWFGLLKFFPNLSPAEKIAQQVISAITFKQIPQNISIIILAIFEVTIGVLFLFRIQKKSIYYLVFFHIACTFLPLFIFPNKIFVDHVYILTLLGQYIIKNLIILVVLIVLYRTNEENKY